MYAEWNTGPYLASDYGETSARELYPAPPNGTPSGYKHGICKAKRRNQHETGTAGVGRARLGAAYMDEEGVTVKPATIFAA